jgi:hypothetical protein
MRGLSGMEIEDLAGAGWWTGFWAGFGETVRAFADGIRTTFEGCANATPNVCDQRATDTIECLTARNPVPVQTPHGMSINFIAGASQISMDCSGSGSTITCNGVAIP